MKLDRIVTDPRTIQFFSNLEERFHKIYRGKYNYSNSIVVNSSSIIEIKCPLHGPFFQKVQDHLANKIGCPKCAKKSRTKSLSLTFERLSAECPKINFIESTFKGLKTKMTAVCVIHGEYSRSPEEFLRGKKCVKCEADIILMKRKCSFIKKAKIKFGGVYNYENISYKNMHSLIKLDCLLHGEIEVTPAKHLGSKSGCPQCGVEAKKKNLEFKSYREKPTLLYYISFKVKEKEYWKIGITTKTIKERFDKEDIKPLKIFSKLFRTGKEAFSVEQEILLKYKDSLIPSYLKPLTSGNTEILDEDVVSEEFFAL